MVTGREVINVPDCAKDPRYRPELTTRDAPNFKVVRARGEVRGGV